MNSEYKIRTHATFGDVVSPLILNQDISNLNKTRDLDNLKIMNLNNEILSCFLNSTIEEKIKSEFEI